MKTKLQFLVSVASLLVFTGAANAKVLNLNDSHINAILNSPNTIQVANNINVADVDRSNIILKATDDKIADNTTTDLSVDSYHHGGGESSGDRHYYINIGAGIALGISSGVFNSEIDAQSGSTSGSTFTYSPAVGFYFSSERAFGDHIAVGAMFNYQSCTLQYKYTTSIYGQTGTDPFGNPIYGYYNATQTDNLAMGGFAFALKITYNITMTNEKLDPYVSLFLGYCFGLFTDNNGNGNSFGGIDGGVVGGGVIGLAGGIRYWFIDNVGVFAEVGYTTGGGYMLANGGLAIKF